MTEAVYGAPAAALAPAARGAVQLSPLILAGAPIEGVAEAALDRVVIAAPPGTLERRYVLAHALRALRPGAELVALAQKTRGGARLARELESFGCAVREHAKAHHRICSTARPVAPAGIEEALRAGGPQRVPRLGLWSQPGLFSWDRLDAGSALLLETAPAFEGRGADLGCGVGVLGLEALKSAAVGDLVLVDLDRRATEAALRNLSDPRGRVLRADLRAPPPELAGLDFVVMNPPFHEAGRTERGLGLAFIGAAARMLRTGGVCRLVANAMLPYEARLAQVFARTRLVAQRAGFKVFEAVR